MVTEGEKNESELRQIRLQNTVMMDIQFSQYVLTPDFKTEFKRISKKTCKECGKDYRVTHWCEPQELQIWIPSWETIIRANFKPVQYEIPEYKFEDYDPIQDLRDEQQLSQVKIPIKPRDQAKLQPKKKQIPKQPPKSKPQPIPVTYTPPANKGQPVRSQYIPKTQTRKLTVQSITQLTQRERLVYEQLKNWRSIQANRERKPPYMIAVDTALMAIVFYRVATTHELMQISGFSTHTAQQYGTDILRIMIRNGMATGIKTYQQKRKPLPTPKIADTDSQTKKIIGGFVACIIFIIIIIVVSSI